MNFKPNCEFCDAPLPNDSRFCDRCGAPKLRPQSGDAAPVSGYSRHLDMWLGFSLLYPEGWKTVNFAVGGVHFENPEGSAVLQFNSYPPDSMINAVQRAEMVLADAPQLEAKLSPGSDDHEAHVVFKGPDWEGMLFSRMTEGGSTVAVGRKKPGTDLDLRPHFETLLTSLESVTSAPKEQVADPVENSFHLVRPKGWNLETSFTLVNNISREPVFLLHPSSTRHISLERAYLMQNFHDAELPRKSEGEEGFFQKVGRAFQEAGTHMSKQPGDEVLPYEKGLEYAVDHFFWPRLKGETPSLERIGFTPLSFNHGELRLRHPGNMVEVMTLITGRYPGAAAGGRWFGGKVFTYRAPAAYMEQFEPVLRGVQQSFRLNPQWLAQENRNFQQRLGQQQAFQQNMLHQRQSQLRANEMAFQNTQAMYNSGPSVLDTGMESWNRQQAMTDHGHHQSVNTVHEWSDYANMNTGTVYALPIHFEKYWDTNRDHIVGTNLAIDPPADWTPLRKV